MTVRSAIFSSCLLIFAFAADRWSNGKAILSKAGQSNAFRYTESELRSKSKPIFLSYELLTRAAVLPVLTRPAHQFLFFSVSATRLGR